MTRTILTLLSNMTRTILTLLSLTAAASAALVNYRVITPAFQAAITNSPVTVTSEGQESYVNEKIAVILESGPHFFTVGFDEDPLAPPSMSGMPVLDALLTDQNNVVHRVDTEIEYLVDDTEIAGKSGKFTFGGVIFTVECLNPVPELDPGVPLCIVNWGSSANLDRVHLGRLSAAERFQDGLLPANLFRYAKNFDSVTSDAGRARIVVSDTNGLLAGDGLFVTGGSYTGPTTIYSLTSGSITLSTSFTGDAAGKVVGYILTSDRRDGYTFLDTQWSLDNITFSTIAKANWDQTDTFIEIRGGIDFYVSRVTLKGGALTLLTGEPSAFFRFKARATPHF